VRRLGRSWACEGNNRTQALEKEVSSQGPGKTPVSPQALVPLAKKRGDSRRIERLFFSCAERDQALLLAEVSTFLMTRPR
jgi:hypothetical protein